MSFLLHKDFISKEGEENLPKYKYSGTDKSILYKHVFSPTAEFVVQNFIPNWLAPNVITLVGFFCTLIPHLLIWNAAGNNLDGRNVPSSLWFLTAIGQFTYMILDNADGKQARKTKNSSPLGLLFDHGCDAMNTFVTALTFFTALNLGNSNLAVFGYVITFSGFYLATWEEYYCEELVLGIINGVNEGLAGIGLMFIITGLFGSELWLTPVFGVQLNLIIVVSFVGLAIVTCIGHFRTVKEKATSYGDAVQHTATYWYLVATCFIVSNFSVTNVTTTPACRFFIYFIGFSFAKLVGILQASHTAHVPFLQFRTSILLPATLINGIILIGNFRGKAITNEENVIFLACLFAMIAHAHFVINIIKQFCRVLNIHCLRIKGHNEVPLIQGKKD